MAKKEEETDIREALAQDQGILHTDIYHYSAHRQVIVGDKPEVRVQCKDWPKGSILKIFHVAPRPEYTTSDQLMKKLAKLEKMVAAIINED